MNACPTCGKTDCRANRLMAFQWVIATGATHDQINNLAPSIKTIDRDAKSSLSREDEELRSHISKHGGCCG